MLRGREDSFQVPRAVAKFGVPGAQATAWKRCRFPWLSWVFRLAWLSFAALRVVFHNVSGGLTMSIVLQGLPLMFDKLKSHLGLYFWMLIYLWLPLGHVHQIDLRWTACDHWNHGERKCLSVKWKSYWMFKTIRHRDPRFSFECVPAVWLSVGRAWVPMLLISVASTHCLSPAAVNLLFKLPFITLVHVPCPVSTPAPLC